MIFCITVDIILRTLYTIMTKPEDERVKITQCWSHGILLDGDWSSVVMVPDLQEVETVGAIKFWHQDRMLQEMTEV